MTPTARSLAECRKRGWEVDIVERRVTRFVTKDFLGCIDLIAITDTGIIGIQATSGANHAARVAKVRAEPRTKLWYERGCTIEVWSYSKRGPRGARKRWVLRTEQVTPLAIECATSELIASGGQ